MSSNYFVGVYNNRYASRYRKVHGSYGKSSFQFRKNKGNFFVKSTIQFELNIKSSVIKQFQVLNDQVKMEISEILKKSVNGNSILTSKAVELSCCLETDITVTEITMDLIYMTTQSAAVEEVRPYVWELINLINSKILFLKSYCQ